MVALTLEPTSVKPLNAIPDYAAMTEQGEGIGSDTGNGNRQNRNWRQQKKAEMEPRSSQKRRVNEDRREKKVNSSTANKQSEQFKKISDDKNSNEEICFETFQEKMTDEEENKEEEEKTATSLKLESLTNFADDINDEVEDECMSTEENNQKRKLSLGSKERRNDTKVWGRRNERQNNRRISRSQIRKKNGVSSISKFSDQSVKNQAGSFSDKSYPNGNADNPSDREIEGDESQRPVGLLDDIPLKGIPKDNRSCRSQFQRTESPYDCVDDTETSNSTVASARDVYFDDRGIRLSLLDASDLPEHLLNMYPVGAMNDRGNFGAWQPRNTKLLYDTSESKLSIPHSNTILCSNFAPPVYDRLQSLGRHKYFEFEHHPDETGRYIELYRNVHTVGRAGHWSRRPPPIFGVDLPDPYVRLAKKVQYQSPQDKTNPPSHIQGQQCKPLSHFDELPQSTNDELYQQQQHQHHQHHHHHHRKHHHHHHHHHNSQRDDGDSKEEDGANSNVQQGDQLQNTANREFPVLAPVRENGSKHHKKSRRHETPRSDSEANQGEQLKQTVFLPPLQGNELRVAVNSNNSLNNNKIGNGIKPRETTNIIEKVASENMYLDSAYYFAPPTAILRDTVVRTKGRKDVWKNPFPQDKIGFSEDHHLALSLYRKAQQNGSLGDENSKPTKTTGEHSQTPKRLHNQGHSIGNENGIRGQSVESHFQKDFGETSAGYQKRRKRILLRNDTTSRLEIEISTSEPVNDVGTTFSHVGDVASIRSENACTSVKSEVRNEDIRPSVSPAFFENRSEKNTKDVEKLDNRRQKNHSAVSEPVTFDELASFSQEKLHHSNAFPNGKLQHHFRDHKSSKLKESSHVPPKNVKHDIWAEVTENDIRNSKSYLSLCVDIVNSPQNDSELAYAVTSCREVGLNSNNGDPSQHGGFAPRKVKQIKATKSVPNTTRDKSNAGLMLEGTGDASRNSVNVLHQSYPVEEWKKLVDTGECGFIVRSFPMESEKGKVSNLVETSQFFHEDGHLLRNGTVFSNMTVLGGIQKQNTMNTGLEEKPDFEIRNSVVNSTFLDRPELAFKTLDTNNADDQENCKTNETKTNEKNPENNEPPEESERTLKTVKSVPVVSLQIPNKHNNAKETVNFKSSKKLEGLYHHYHHRKAKVVDKDLFVGSREQTSDTDFSNGNQIVKDLSLEAFSLQKDSQPLPSVPYAYPVKKLKDDTSSILPVPSTMPVKKNGLLGRHHQQQTPKQNSSEIETSVNGAGPAITIDGQKPYTSNARVL